MLDNYINPEKYSGVAKDSTINSAKEEILEAIENAKPEVDLSEVAKQGDNQEATNSAIYTRLEDALYIIDVQYANQINQLIGE